MIDAGRVLWTKKDKRRDYALRRQRGITLVEYRVRLDEQGGLCAICREPPGDRGLAVDHDHQTGKIRGLLCTRCNVGLGYFRDARNTLLSAVAYLDEHEALHGD